MSIVTVKPKNLIGNNLLSIAAQMDWTRWSKFLSSPTLERARARALDVTAAAVKSVVPNLKVQTGLYWICLATEDAVQAFYRNSGVLSGGDVLTGCYYLLGAWGALTNPCPAVTAIATARFSAYLLLDYP